MAPTQPQEPPPLASNEQSDPNVAPMHHDIQERFASWQVALCVALGSIAIVAGIVLGIVLQND
jgi:hypothetical protein